MRVNGAPKVSLNPAISASLSVTYFSSRSSYQPLPCQVSRNADKESLVSSEKTSIEFRVIHSYTVGTTAAKHFSTRPKKYKQHSSSLKQKRSWPKQLRAEGQRRKNHTNPYNAMLLRPIPTARRSNQIHLTSPHLTSPHLNRSHYYSSQPFPVLRRRHVPPATFPQCVPCSPPRPRRDHVLTSYLPKKMSPASEQICHNRWLVSLWRADVVRTYESVEIMSRLLSAWKLPDGTKPEGEKVSHRRETTHPKAARLVFFVSLRPISTIYYMDYILRASSFSFLFSSNSCFCRLPHWPTSSTTTS